MFKSLFELLSLVRNKAILYFAGLFQKIGQKTRVVLLVKTGCAREKGVAEAPWGFPTAAGVERRTASSPLALLRGGSEGLVPSGPGLRCGTPRALGVAALLLGSGGARPLQRKEQEARHPKSSRREGGGAHRCRGAAAAGGPPLRPPSSCPLGCPGPPLRPGMPRGRRGLLPPHVSDHWAACWGPAGAARPGTSY